jgi:hypothetical protein
MEGLDELKIYSLVWGKRISNIMIFQRSRWGNLGGFHVSWLQDFASS